MGTDKRARQKAGRQARIEAARAAETRTKRMRTLSRVASLGVIVIGGIFLYSWLSGGDDEGETTPVTLAPPPGEDDADASTDADLEAAAEPVYTPYTEDDYGTTECIPADGVDEPILDFDDQFARCIEPGEPLTAVFTTTMGVLEVGLDTTNTPGTVNNFVNLARAGYYDDIEIFRSNTGIGILQSGAPHTNTPADEGPGYMIGDEGTGFSYAPGQLVMARSSLGAGAQFFFNVTDAAAALNTQGNFVVFGETDAAGVEVLQSILDLHVDTDPAVPGEGAPGETVVIESVEIVEG